MQLNRLTPTKIKAIKAPCKVADGGGLWLYVTQGKTGLNFKWVYRYRLNGKDREMGLGSFPVITLAAVRETAMDQRRLVASGVDPIAAASKAPAVTFDQCASSFISTNESGWKNKKHRDQWESTLKTYASPVIGILPIANIKTSHIIRILEPIWAPKTETATRVRQRVEKVLDWATVQGYRSGDNPARWRGHLDHILPPPTKVKKTKHFAAMDWRVLPAFIKEIGGDETISARALVFTILTAARTSESSAAQWSEIDGESWTIPKERMKAGRIHRVPLSTQVTNIMTNLPRLLGSNHLFPGMRNQHISNLAMLAYLKTRHPSLTVHGFRSSFRDWAAEATNYPAELIESCLAHVIKDKTQAAYQRGDMLDRRREVMQAWADYVFGVRQVARLGATGRHRTAY